jgi:hypothetical protein
MTYSWVYSGNEESFVIFRFVCLRDPARETNPIYPLLLQGYHDVITIIFLTLPSEMHLPCAEKLSLHRVRDSMGAGLEPLLGLLRYAI